MTTLQRYTLGLCADGSPGMDADSRGDYIEYQPWMDAVTPDELAALRRDAERYRWLRECDWDGDRAVHVPGDPELLSGELLDNAIDRARGVK